MKITKALSYKSFPKLKMNLPSINHAKNMFLVSTNATIRINISESIEIH